MTVNLDYVALLEHSFAVEQEGRECPPRCRLAYLSESVFNFTTYDSEADELFAAKAIEVCRAINDGTTFDYIKTPENYQWFLLMCNMPFFADRIEWGTSIRGAWWAGRPGRPIELDSCGFWLADIQLTDTMTFSTDEWKRFIAAVIKFGEPPPK